MTDEKAPLSRKAGRGFLKALKGLFGGKNVARAGESLRVLRDEFREGAREDDDEPRRVPHTEKP